MATNNMTSTGAEQRRPMDPAALGENYRQMTIYTAIIVFIALFVGAAFWSAYYFVPVGILEGDEVRPLSAQIPLDVMPALPDSLAEIYDDLNDTQRAQISDYEFIDRDAGIVRIPVEDAAAIMLDQDLFPVREASVGTAASDERGSDSEEGDG